MALPGTPEVVTYLSDVEGLWPKLETFLEGNPHVRLDGEGRLQVAPGAVFVFGGDAIDRGPWARRIVGALLEAKERQPEQVILLAGNRDINKLRLRRELTGQPPRRTPDEVRAASRGQLLRWIFAHTMGAKLAFGSRSDELRREGRGWGDDEVVESFLDDVQPEGSLCRYLARCQLVYRAGPTLFVHGGVTDENLGQVPGDARRYEDVSEWGERLNGWYRGQIEAYERNEVSASGEPGWGPLVAYQAPLPGTKLNQTSVVYARPTDDEGNPFLPSGGVIEALGRAGVRRVVVGHTPVGDSPALLRQRGFEYLVADNSYSPVEAGAQVHVRADRVESIARVRVSPEGPTERVRMLVEFDGESPIGRRVEGSGYLVKGELESGDFLLHRSGANFAVDQRAASARELGRMRLVEARR